MLDIAPTPQAVDVPASLCANLARLGRLAGGAAALVSGRPLHDLDRLFGPLPLALVGGHGAEIRLWRDGVAQERRTPPLPPWIGQRCREIAAASDNILIEDKGYSIALHFRSAPQQEGRIRNAVTAMLADATGDNLAMLHGKAVIEIKRAGVNKGSGIRMLMEHGPFAGRRPVFIGDDITDEDAFAAMPEFDGIALSVGRTVPGAERAFETPAQVRDWIEHICHAGDQSR